MAPRCRATHPATVLSVLAWFMVGLAVWHFAVLVPDRFGGGIIGACVAAVIGAATAGYLLPTPGLHRANPPGLAEVAWPLIGATAALTVSYCYGARVLGGSNDRGRR